MNYNSTLLTTVAECDTLLNMSNKEKDTLEFRMTSLTRQQNNSNNSVAELEAEMISVEAKIAALTTAINAQPDGYEKNKLIAERARYEYRRTALVVQEDKFGAIAHLDREYDIGKLEQQLEENAAFIAAITARKNEL